MIRRIFPIKFEFGTVRSFKKALKNHCIIFSKHCKLKTDVYKIQMFHITSFADLSAFPEVQKYLFLSGNLCFCRIKVNKAQKDK